MRPIERIRKHVFGVDQAEFASIAQVSQGTVSRWERGKLVPSQQDLEAIRQAAVTRGLLWNDSWFFDQVPSPAAALGEARP
jgi:transcriptional regulator with XRE-family HTH domain